MASTRPLYSIPTSNPSQVVRKKATEACERCREKRIRCNGTQPCDQCKKKESRCVFALAPVTAKGHEALAEKLDTILARLDRIEQGLVRNTCFNGPHEQGDASTVFLSKTYAGDSRPATTYQLFSADMSPTGFAQLNKQTGCFEYYGGTSTFVIASVLAERVDQLEEVVDTPTKKRRLDHGGDFIISQPDAPRSLGLEELPGFCDYVVPPDALRHDRSIRSCVADRHLDSYFQTIHVFIPLFDEPKFRERYGSIRVLFGDRRLFSPASEDRTRPQFVCLLYAVLALGALYEPDREDSSSWASWYFAEAQDMLGRLLEATNLQLVQAALLLGAYAQHALKPNLAYILTGTAIRLAFSIGLNIESVHSSLSCDIQEARRTYWMIYIQDFELSLDSGRPFSMSASQMSVSYPAEQPVPQDGSLSQPSLTKFIRHLADFVGISRKILKLISKAEMPGLTASVETEILRKDLMRWRASLPEYLQFDLASNDMHGNALGHDLYAWHRRQQSSLRIHFNLAIIILLQGSREKKNRPKHQGHDEPSLASFHQSCRLDAARDMIRHIYKLFELAPRLRRWSYYCFYCLQATLVLLPKIAEDHYVCRKFHHVHGSLCSCQSSKYKEDWKLCNLAFQIFERIDLKASQTCGEAVRQFLKRWKIPDTGECPHNTRSVNSEGGGELRSHSASVAPAIRPDMSHQLPGTSDLFSSSLGKSSQSNGPLADSEGISRVDDLLDIVSPPVSLSGIQVELYEALYGKYDDNNFESATRLNLANEDHLGLSSDAPASTDLDWLAYCSVDTDNNYMARH